MKRCFLCRLRFKDWRQTLEDGSVFLQSYSFYSFTKFSACFCRKHGWNYWFENLVNGCFWFPTYYSICLFWFETRHKKKANILLISHGKDDKDFFLFDLLCDLLFEDKKIIQVMMIKSLRLIYSKICCKSCLRKPKYEKHVENCSWRPDIVYKFENQNLVTFAENLKYRGKLLFLAYYDYGTTTTRGSLYNPEDR